MTGSARLNNLGAVAFEQGDHPAAPEWLYEQSLAPLRELGERTLRPACWAIWRTPPRAISMLLAHD
jgi:hypothetical protein